VPREPHHHRAKRRRNPFLLFLKAYGVEILIVVALALAVFLLFEQMDIRATLLGWFSAAAVSGANAATRLLDTLVGFRSRIGLSELIAIPMLIGVLILLIWRIRWRLRGTAALANTHCPRCGEGLQRVHRRFPDRVISIFVPVRRYRCSNRNCGWMGVRVYTHSDPGHAKPAS
jgi:hypothetical protein